MAEEKKEEMQAEAAEEKETEETAAENAAAEETNTAETEDGEGKAAEAAEESPNDSEKNAAEPEEKKDDEGLQAQFLRLQADFQNFRRRSEAEKADIYAYANEKIVLQVLDVIDNFDRAMSAAPADDKFAEGMQLILKQLTDVLGKNNVSVIDALGKDFDPMFHNAVMTEPAAEGQDAGKVTKVLQKGYTLNSKVIRPAMVAVSQ